MKAKTRGVLIAPPSATIEQVGDALADMHTEASDAEKTRAASVSDFMFLADTMTTLRLVFEAPGQDSRENWLAYRAARDELQGALVSGVVDFCEGCRGVGERSQTVGYPPDDYWDEVLNCPDCNGSGKVSDALDRALTAGLADRARHLLAAAKPCCGFPVGGPCPDCPDTAGVSTSPDAR